MNGPVASIFRRTGAWLLCGMVLLYGSVVSASDAGKKIADQGAAHASAVACASCHGADGGGNDVSGFPRLAGLDAAYLEKQLQSYRDGSNRNPVMASMASSLSADEVRDVAAYYAGLDAVSHARAPANEPTDTG